MARADRNASVKAAPREQVFVSRADRRDAVPVSDYFGTPVRGIDSHGAGAPTSFFCAQTFYGSRIQSIGFNRPRGAVRSYGVPTVSKTVPKVLAVLLVAGAMTLNVLPAQAQESGAVVKANIKQGAYERLSPASQEIAKALYDAQLTPDDVAPSGNSANGSGEDPASSPPVLRFTLDEIAAMKRDGRGWGQVFRELYGHGVIQERNLGQVARDANRAMPASPGSVAASRRYRPAPTVITYADGNSVTVKTAGLGVRAGTRPTGKGK